MDYLKDLCQDLEISTSLEKNDQGFYLLPLTDSLQIEVKSLDPGVYFYAPIASCPEKSKEDFFIHLMTANLFGQGTLGAAIGMNPKENLLTLSKKMPYDVKYGAFRESIEDFANIVDYWREEVENHVKLSEGGIL